MGFEVCVWIFPNPIAILRYQLVSNGSFQSNTNYPEPTQPPQVKGSGPQAALTSDTSHKSRVPRLPTLLSNLGAHSETEQGNGARAMPL